MTEPEEYKPPPIKLTLPKPQLYPSTTPPVASKEQKPLISNVMEAPAWGMLQYNPTTTVHEGGTVLKFKFRYIFYTLTIF